MKLLIVLALLVSVAIAEEPKVDDWGDEVQQLPKGTPRWELTIVDGNDLIDLPRQHNTKSSCVELGVNYVRAVPTVKGFICEQEFG